MQVGIPRDKPIHYLKKWKFRNALQPFPGDHLSSISILETCSIELISLGDLSVLIHFSICNCISAGPQPLLNHKKAVSLATALHANCRTYDLAAKSTMWYIDTMQDCDNLAIDSRLSENTEGRWGRPQLLFLTEVFDFIPLVNVAAVPIFTAFSCSQRQTVAG